jgi:peroxiredoxin (alkyl hydroperoxide reductase subunit C)
MSVDQVFSHIKMEEWIKETPWSRVQFPIIADTGAIANKLGLIHPGKGTNTVEQYSLLMIKAKIEYFILSTRTWT